VGCKIGWAHLSPIDHADALMLKLPDGTIRLARGLNYGTGALGNLDHVTNRVIEHAPEIGGINADILRRAEYLSACVRFICDVEKASGHERISVGGDTSFATIGMDGVIHFKPPYKSVSPAG
jgi:hypothetical protein